MSENRVRSGARLTLGVAAVLLGMLLVPSSLQALTEHSSGQSVTAVLITVGLQLVLTGVWLLISNVGAILSIWIQIWPLFLLAAGGLLLWQALGRASTASPAESRMGGRS